MTEPHAGDADNELKERIARVLFATGFSCRYNVDVMTEYEGKSEQMTDVDVMGTRFDATLVPSLMVADCKSGREGKPKERLFWLSGVKQRYRATDAIFVKQNVDPTRLLSEYGRLGVRILSSETLETMEALTQANTLRTCGPVAVGSVVQAETALRRVKEANRPAYNYLRHGYWEDEPHVQVETLLLIMHDIKTPELAYGRLSAFGLLATSALRLCGDAALVTPARRADAVRALAGGGIGNVAERRRLLEHIHQFTRKEIEEVTGKKWRVGQETFTTFLDPPHSGVLVDLVERLLRNPSSPALPRALDIIAHSLGVQSAKPDFGPLLGGAITLDGLRQGIGDLVAFAERAGALGAEQRTEWIGSLP